MAFPLPNIGSSQIKLAAVRAQPVRPATPRELELLGLLGLRRRGNRGLELAHCAQLQAGKPPLPVLGDKHQGRAKLPRNGRAAICCLLDLTAYYEGGAGIDAHIDLIYA